MVSVGGIFNNSASTALSLLGASGASTAAPTMSAQAGFKPFVQGEPQKIADFTKQSSYQQTVAYFKAHITTVKSVDDVVHDPKLLNFVLTAFNLQDDAQYPAKVKAILNSDLSDRRSYANSLIDPRYQQFAKEFNAHLLGMANFHSSATIDDLVSKYTTNSYEASLDNVNPALRSAAYFLHNIGNITDAYNILGDPVLRRVVTTALGLPQTIANLPVEDQRRLINSKLDIAKLETTGGAASSSPTSAAQTTANKDAAAVLNGRTIVSAAQAAAKTVGDRITALQKDYKNLAAIQDPNGQYAAEIPVQQAAAPVLVEQQALLNTAQRALGTVTGDLTQLQSLIHQAGSSTNTTPLTELKAQFQNLYDEIAGAIDGATYRFDNGTGGASYTAQNLIDGSLSAPISVQYDSAGHAVSVNPQDLGAGSSFRSQLDAANTAFQALNGSWDSASIQAATTAVTAAQSASNVVSQFVSADAAKFSQAIAAVPRWAGTYDSAALSRGVQSLADTGVRITQINQLVAQIRDVAKKSAQLEPSDDRTALQNQYSDLVTRLGTAINTPGGPNLDNLLAANPASATPGYYSYAIDLAGQFTIQARTSDLVGSVLDTLAGTDVGSLAGSNAVLGMISGGIQDAIAAAGRLLAVDSQTFSLPSATLDPRTAVDSRYRQLASDIAGLANSAASNGANLLDPHQAAIALTVTTANMSITIAPNTTYNIDVTQMIVAGSQALPTDASDTSGALAQLEAARFNNVRLLSSLNQQLAQLDLAAGLTKAQIARLTNQQKTAAPAGTPLNATPAAVKLVQKYLAQVDAQSAVGGTGGGIKSYALRLLQGVNLSA